MVSHADELPSERGFTMDIKQRDQHLQIAVLMIEQGREAGECHVNARGSVIWSPDALQSHAAYFRVAESLRCGGYGLDLARHVRRLYT